MSVHHTLGHMRCKKKLPLCAGWVSAIALLLSCAFAYCGWGESLQHAAHVCPHSCLYKIKVTQAIVLALWTLTPPMYFFFEWFYIVKPLLGRNTAARSQEFEEYKFGQDICAKVWIATASILLLLYFWKDIGSR